MALPKPEVICCFLSLTGYLSVPPFLHEAKNIVYGEKKIEILFFSVCLKVSLQRQWIGFAHRSPYYL
jgi:hypothetical protein